MIYVLGSINADLVANVRRMPKAGETLSADSFFINQGGKGANQAVAIGKLGGDVSMIGKVGDDSYADMLRESLGSAGVNVGSVSRADCGSGIALIIVEDGDNRIILSKGANHKITRADVDEGLKDAAAGDALVLQLEIPLDTVEYALCQAKKKGMITVLNPAPAVPLPSAVLQNTDIITPNESETEILTGVFPHDEAHIALAVRHFYKAGVKNVIITMGERGSAVSFGQEITLVPAKKVKAVDTTGAGDTFVGAMTVRLTQGADIVSACRFATCASAITVRRKGAAVSIPTLQEVEREYPDDCK